MMIQMSNLPDSSTFQAGTQQRVQVSNERKINTHLRSYHMTRNNQLSTKNTSAPSQLPDNQLTLLLRQFLQLSRNSSENTGLIIAYLSLLGFLAAGVFGIFGLLISQRFNTPSPQVSPPLPLMGTVTQQSTSKSN